MKLILVVVKNIESTHTNFSRNNYILLFLAFTNLHQFRSQPIATLKSNSLLLQLQSCSEIIYTISKYKFYRKKKINQSNQHVVNFHPVGCNISMYASINNNYSESGSVHGQCSFWEKIDGYMSFFKYIYQNLELCSVKIAIHK